MRHNQNRRSRGRSRKGPNPLTRSYESNGPDVKVRGTAMHVAEKYMSLARDAHSSGDPVAAENYLQHAEHYNRIVMAAQAQLQQSQPVQFRDQSDEGDEDERQMNGRPHDRFGFGRGDEDGDDGYDGGEEEGERSFQPRPSQAQQTSQRNDRNDRSYRNDRNDRGDRNERSDYRGEPRPDHRAEQRSEPRSDQRPDSRSQPRPEMRSEPAAERPEIREPTPPPVQASEAAAPVSEENGGSRPRRRRSKPRSDNGAEPPADTTRDGEAALAAFPD